MELSPQRPKHFTAIIEIGGEERERERERE
jgi:hypothetical protein